MSGSYYPTQPVFPFIGATKTLAGGFTLSPVTLTATAADNRKEIDVDGMQQLVLYIRHIAHASDTNAVLAMTVEFSPDGTNYYQEATEEVTAGSGTVTEYQATRQFTSATGGTTYSFRVAIPVADLKKVRIGFRESDAGTNFGTLSVLAVTSGQ